MRSRTIPARWLAGLLALVVLGAGPVAARGEEQTFRVYFIGNSVTDTVRYGALAELAQSRGHKHVFGRHMIPGAPLSWIWNHPDQGFEQEPFGYYRRALTRYQWDALSLQPFDRQLDKGDDSDLVVARRFIDLARQKSPDVQVYVYSRWPRRDQPRKGVYHLDYEKKWLRPYTGRWDGSNETRDYFVRLTLALRQAYPPPARPVLLVPAGDVLLELDRRMKAGQVPGYRDIGQVYADGIHLNDVGSYIVGCTFYATLYRDNPVGLPSAPYKVHDARLARVIQETVWDVVSKNNLAGVAQPRKERNHRSTVPPR